MKKSYKKPEIDVVFATPCHLMSPSKISGGGAGDNNNGNYGGIGGEGSGEGEGGDGMNDARQHNWMWDTMEDEY